MVSFQSVAKGTKTVVKYRRPPFALGPYASKLDLEDIEAKENRNGSIPQDCDDNKVESSDVTFGFTA